MGIEAAIIMGALATGYQAFSANEAQKQAKDQQKKQEDQQYKLEEEAKTQLRQKEAVQKSLQQSAAVRGAAKVKSGFESTVLTGPLGQGALPQPGSTGGTKTVLGS